MSSLETQNFTDGLFNPVKPALLKQFFDEGIDTRLLLLLFFSGAQENGQLYLNNFKCNYADKRCRDDLFVHYLPGINRLAKERLVGNIYAELTPVGSSVSWPNNTSVKDIAGIDTAKYRVVVSGQSATVYSVSEPKFELCARLGDGKGLVHPISRKPCKDVYYVSPFISDKTGLKALPVRSVYQVIEYLGQVLEYQEANAGEARCITLNADPEHKYRCDSNEILFQVNPTRRSAPLVTANYLGVPYTAAIGPCEPKAYCDHSAEVMKIVSLLINVNKSATDIPQVPLVRIAQ